MIIEDYKDYLSDLSDGKAVFWDGLDDAIIGAGRQTTDGVTRHYAVYDYELIISALIEQGMTRCEAIEYHDFNIAGTGGENFPVTYYARTFQ